MNKEEKRLKEIKHRFAGNDIRFSMSRMDYDWLLSLLAEKDRKITNLKEHVMEFLTASLCEAHKERALKQTPKQFIKEQHGCFLCERNRAEQASTDRDHWKARAEKCEEWKAGLAAGRFGGMAAALEDEG